MKGKTLKALYNVGTVLLFVGAYLIRNAPSLNHFSGKIGLAWLVIIILLGIGFITTGLNYQYHNKWTFRSLIMVYYSVAFTFILYGLFIITNNSMLEIITLFAIILIPPVTILISSITFITGIFLNKKIHTKNI